MVSVTPLLSRDPDERKDSTCNHSITKNDTSRDTRKNWIRKKKREVANRTTRAVQYLPGDRVVEILRLPGKGEFDCDAKKRRQREERCCCCGSKRGSVFGQHVSFCEEAFFLIINGNGGFVGNYLYNEIFFKVANINNEISYYFQLLIFTIFFLASINFKFMWLSSLRRIFKNKKKVNPVEKEEYRYQNLNEEDIKYKNNIFVAYK